MTDHLDRMHVGPDRFARWVAIARAAGPLGTTLLIELTDFSNDPVRHRLRRAADVARFTSGAVPPALKPLLEALATELEVEAKS